MNAPTNMKQTMRNMLNADKNIDFSKISVPTTIIWGREDKITPLKDGQTLNTKIVGSKLCVVEDARHSPFYNHAEEVAKLIANEVKP
jgi:pimeloyl-ACP methyl ester carboxylesterase